jgi:hypothetical protein
MAEYAVGPHDVGLHDVHDDRNVSCLHSRFC